ncbi:MAG: GNAT family N-acetyltransferase [bacterium]|nr:GNAT family N-acetyltransferase [bacterium]
MNINFSNTQSFGSIKNPVKPFEIDTPQGKLYVSEVTKNTYNYKNTANHVIKFANKNISKSKLGAFISNLFKSTAPEILTQNDDATLLVARDENNKICGSMFAYADEKSKKMLEIYDVAVDKKYRGNNVSTKMFNAISKDDYDELFLQAKKSAVPVYKKWGFEEFKPKDKAEEVVLKIFAMIGTVASFTMMHKSLNENSKTWLQYMI